MVARVEAGGHGHHGAVGAVYYIVCGYIYMGVLGGYVTKGTGPSGLFGLGLMGGEEPLRFESRRLSG